MQEPMASQQPAGKKSNAAAGGAAADLFGFI
jgi:hypothetical protein